MKEKQDNEGLTMEEFAAVTKIVNDIAVAASYLNLESRAVKVALGEALITHGRQLVVPHTSDYLEHIRIFVEECCDICSEYTVSFVSLWHAYCAWGDENRIRVLSRLNFHKHLMKNFPLVTKRACLNKVEFTGINLKIAS